METATPINGNTGLMEVVARMTNGIETDTPELAYFNGIRIAICALSKNPAATLELLFALDDACQRVNETEDNHD